MVVLHTNFFVPEQDAAECEVSLLALDAKWFWHAGQKLSRLPLEVLLGLAIKPRGDFLGCGHGLAPGMANCPLWRWGGLGLGLGLDGHSDGLHGGRRLVFAPVHRRHGVD
jgi:hypothetical protein